MKNGPDPLRRAYYQVIVKTGRLLKRFMWKIVEARQGGRRIHPKHLALPESEHHWYAGQIRKEWRVLDLGCDRGGHAPALVAAGATVLGVDANREAIAQAVKLPGAEYEALDLEEPLPLADQAFDAVLALDVIEHLYERTRFLEEVKRVLKPGGMMFLSAPNAESTWKRTARDLGLFVLSDPDHKIEYQEAELVGLIEGAGFQIRTLEPVVFDTPWSDWIDFIGAISLTWYKNAWMKKRRKVMSDPMESTGFRIIAQKPAERSDD